MSKMPHSHGWEWMLALGWKLCWTINHRLSRWLGLFSMMAEFQREIPKSKHSKQPRQKLQITYTISVLLLPHHLGPSSHRACPDSKWWKKIDSISWYRSGRNPLKSIWDERYHGTIFGKYNLSHWLKEDTHQECFKNILSLRICSLTGLGILGQGRNPEL